jgi:hypothetical protein
MLKEMFNFIDETTDKYVIVFFLRKLSSKFFKYEPKLDQTGKAFLEHAC